MAWLDRGQAATIRLSSISFVADLCPLESPCPDWRHGNGTVAPIRLTPHEHKLNPRAAGYYNEAVVLVMGPSTPHL